MSPTAKIGFIGSSVPSSPHHDSFKAFIPKVLSKKKTPVRLFTMHEAKSILSFARRRSWWKSMHGME